jgi:hypothetical protein
MELLESASARPRQARYQAALRPDMKCKIDSKALSNATATPVHHFWSRLSKKRKNGKTAKRQAAKADSRDQPTPSPSHGQGLVI